MLIIIGETSASKLLGRIFPEAEVVHAYNCAMVNAPNSVVIAKDAAPGIINAFGVITSESSELNIPRGVQLIVCGNSPKNTVCVTSRTSDKLTLALNRAVKTKDGVCEPLELPVELIEGCSEFDYMSVFAASLLEGMIR